MQTKKSTLKQRYQKAVNYGAVVAVPLVVTPAHAVIDVTEGTTQLGLALAAIAGLGAAKLAPAALTWVWSLITRTAQRS